MMFDNKEWKPTDDLRPADSNETELFMKYCPTAKKNQEVYVTRGIIEEIQNAQYFTSTASGTAIGASQTGIGSMMGGAMRMLDFKIDFKNGYKHIVNGKCVLYSRDRDLNLEVTDGTPCTLMWIKKHRGGYEFRYVIPDGITHDTPITWCRMCSKEMRTEDVGPDGLCLFCHKPVNPKMHDLFK